MHVMLIYIAVAVVTYCLLLPNTLLKILMLKERKSFDMNIQFGIKMLRFDFCHLCAWINVNKLWYGFNATKCNIRICPIIKICVINPDLHSCGSCNLLHNALLKISMPKERKTFNMNIQFGIKMLRFDFCHLCAWINVNKLWYGFKTTKCNIRICPTIKICVIIPKF